MEHSEYVQCLIAAGWISAGDVDDDYQEYLRSIRYDDVQPLDYEGWQATKALWEEANAEYMAEIDPFYHQPGLGSELPSHLKRREKELMDRMMSYEVALGY